MKSHTPADGIPWFENARYITVGRDGRDAFMSWCNHMSRMKMTEMLNEQAAEEGIAELKTFDGVDYKGYFHEWLEENNFFDVVASYWARRDQANLLFVHFNDLKSDLEHEMRRIAKFLDINLEESQWPAMVERCTFEGMRNADKKVGDFDVAFEGGIKGFVYKGTNGRWRDVLDEDDLADYQRKVAQTLPEEAARWVESGSLYLAGSDLMGSE
jgi:aryl sulfotransferase